MVLGYNALQLHIINSLTPGIRRVQIIWVWLHDDYK